MNKLIFALCIFCSQHVFAQKVLPKFGQVDKSEFAVNCEFEKDPDAVVLFDKG